MIPRIKVSPSIPKPRFVSAASKRSSVAAWHTRSFTNNSTPIKPPTSGVGATQNVKQPNKPVRNWQPVVEIEDEADDDVVLQPQEPYVNPITGEVNGPRGPEPTRHNDWHIKGRCSDF